MKKLTALLLVAGALLWGCSLAREAAQVPAGPPLPYHFTLNFGSKIADPYYVLSGPIESYRRFPFNRWAKSALQTRLAALSGDPSGPAVNVDLRLLELKTGYSQVGDGPTLADPRYGGIGRLPLLAGDDMDSGDGPYIPSEIHKSVDLKADLTVSRDGRELLHKPLEIHIKTVIYWRDFDAWSYDYGHILNLAIHRLSRDVEDNLRQTLAHS